MSSACHHQYFHCRNCQASGSQTRRLKSPVSKMKTNWSSSQVFQLKKKYIFHRLQHTATGASPRSTVLALTNSRNGLTSLGTGRSRSFFSCNLNTLFLYSYYIIPPRRTQWNSVSCRINQWSDSNFVNTSASKLSCIWKPQFILFPPHTAHNRNCLMCWWNTEVK